MERNKKNFRDFCDFCVTLKREGTWRGTRKKFCDFCDLPMVNSDATRHSVSELPLYSRCSRISV